ncbi:MAG: hypothetical protein JWM12_1378, partial [Ilumatobacteraceae bacterium]|nr:hypothetical protein [Ilumatobacteraceae bacterium]
VELEPVSAEPSSAKSSSAESSSTRGAAIEPLSKDEVAHGGDALSHAELEALVSDELAAIDRLLGAD